MELEEKFRERAARIGEQILDSLVAISTAAAEAAEGDVGPSINSLVLPSNTMVGESRPERLIRASASERRAGFRILAGDPFIARIEVEWLDGRRGRETYYFSRGASCGLVNVLPDARFTTSLSPLGALAEYGSGEVAEVSLGEKPLMARILAKAVLDRHFEGERWDAVVSQFELEIWGAVDAVVRAETLRRALEGPLSASSVVKDANEMARRLLAEIEAGEAEKTRYRAKVLKRIALRDQAILDRFQGKIFRAPLDRQLLLIGPPGSGKTTTLIRRLAQKRTVEALSEEDAKKIAAYSAERFMSPSSWAMFAPSDLLKSYLSGSFSLAGVPDVRNVRTWENERSFLGRDVFDILRSAVSKRGFQLDADGSPLADESSGGLIKLHDAFARHFEARLHERCKASVTALSVARDGRIKMHAVAFANALEGAETSFDFGLRSIDRASDMKADLAIIEGRIKDVTDRILTLIIGREGAVVIENVMKYLSAADIDADADAEDDSVGEGALRQTRADPRMEAVDAIRQAIRYYASSSKAARPARGRSADVISIIGSRMPQSAAFGSLGDDIDLRAQMQDLLQTPRRSVLDIAAEYARFRKDHVGDENVYSSDAEDFVAEGRLSAHEVDVLLLIGLRNARRLIAHARRFPNTALRRSEWLSRIEDVLLAQVFVDEATDLSPIQLACTIEMTDPGLRSWFASGDFRQRITTHGIGGRAEIEWLNRVTGAEIELRSIEIGYRQSPRLKAFADRLAALIEPSSEEAHAGSESQVLGDTPPLLREGVEGEALADWLANRIVDVQRNIGFLPSMAIFVDDGSRIGWLADAVGMRLKKLNVEVRGHADGLVAGDAREVRVFDIRDVKGTEFEAVFFVGIDQMAKRLPALFLQLMYVGATRAATYLCLTCADHLPEELDPLRHLLSDGKW